VKAAYYQREDPSLLKVVVDAAIHSRTEGSPRG
jgi:hypothetical protein